MLKLGHYPFIRMVKILFKGNFTAAGSMLLNCTDVPDPAFSEPEFEFEYNGEHWTIVDMNDHFGCSIKETWRDIPWEKKDFLAKILPWMLRRLDYRKEWRRK